LIFEYGKNDHFYGSYAKSSPINASIWQNPVTVQMAAGFLPMNLKLLEMKELFLAVWRK
jgi:hypothetical protein